MSNAFHTFLGKHTNRHPNHILFSHIHICFCASSLLIGRVEDKKELEKLYGPAGTPPKEQGEYKTELKKHKSFIQQQNCLNICGIVLTVFILVRVNKFTCENHDKYDTLITIDLTIRAFNYTLQQYPNRRNPECPWHQGGLSRKRNRRKPKQKNPRKVRLLMSWSFSCI